MHARYSHQTHPNDCPICIYDVVKVWCPYFARIPYSTYIFLLYIMWKIHHHHPNLLPQLFQMHHPWSCNYILYLFFVFHTQYSEYLAFICYMTKEITLNKIVFFDIFRGGGTGTLTKIRVNSVFTQKLPIDFFPLPLPLTAEKKD